MKKAEEENNIFISETLVVNSNHKILTRAFSNICCLLLNEFAGLTHARRGYYNIVHDKLCIYNKSLPTK